MTHGLSPEELEKIKAKIENAKTTLPQEHKDYDWIDGFRVVSGRNGIRSVTDFKVGFVYVYWWDRFFYPSADVTFNRSFNCFLFNSLETFNLRA